MKMKMKMKLFTLLAGLLAASVVQAWSPPSRNTDSYVTDLGGNLSAGSIALIDGMLTAMRDSTKAQGAVLTVPTLDGMDKQQFATETFKAWGVGDKNLNNGFLLLVCVPERKWFCATGYGLESHLTDSWLTGPLKDKITPMFKAGKNEDAIVAAVAAISGKVLSGVATGAVATEAEAPPGEPFPWWLFLAWAAGIALAAFIAVMIRGEIKRRKKAAEAAEALAREIRAMNDTIQKSSAWLRAQRPIFETSVGRLYPDTSKAAYRRRFDSLEKDAQEYIATITADNTDSLFEKREVSGRLDSFKSKMLTMFREMDALFEKAQKVKSFDTDAPKRKIEEARALINRAEEAKRQVNSRWPSRGPIGGNAASLVSESIGSYESARRGYESAVKAGEWDRADSHIASMKTAANLAWGAVKGPIDLLSSLEEAVRLMPSKMADLARAVDDSRRAKSKFKGSSSSASSEHRAVEEAADALKSAQSHPDPLDALNRVSSVIAAAEAMASKWKKLERRRVEEEEEEERRRRRASSDSATSAAIGFGIGSMYSGSDSSSSSSFDFGGGDSGGSGGGGDW